MLTLEFIHDLVEKHRGELRAPVAAFELRGKPFDSTIRPSLMGVINLSSDSWYRESVCLNTDMALHRGRMLQAEGADLIDIGAESTLHHARRQDVSAQKNVLLPVVRELSQEGLLVSVETYEPAVAEACLKAGAAVLNLTASVGTETLYRMASEHDAGVVICYVQGPHVREVESLTLGEDHTNTLREYFARQTDLAVKAGVKRIWIDPGMGFYYKNLQDSRERVAYQLSTLLNSFRLRALGWPVCHALPHAFEYFGDEVRTAESFFAVAALLGKTDLLRTHEVSKVSGVIRSMGAL